MYELYGNNGRSDAYKHVANPNADPEKSKTNEFKIEYLINKKLSLENIFYKSTIEDALLYNGNYNGGSGYTNENSDLNQKGIESALLLKAEINNINCIILYLQVGRLMEVDTKPTGSYIWV